MTDIPIIFSTPMVLALLAGRKTMTRRLAWRDNPHGLGQPVRQGNTLAWSSRKPTPWQRVIGSGAMNAPAKITDPILAPYVAAYRAREVHPTGHAITMGDDVDNRSRALSVARCECGAVIRLLKINPEAMEAGIEQHWQRFDHVEDRGQPLGQQDSGHCSGAQPERFADHISAGEKDETGESAGQQAAHPGGESESVRETDFAADSPVSSRSPGDGTAALLSPPENETNKTSPPKHPSELAALSQSAAGAFHDPAPPIGAGDDDEWMLRLAEQLAWREEDAAEPMTDEGDVAPIDEVSGRLDLKRSVTILRGDCREVLRTLPDNSVHCVVTSPPYWGLRDYGVPASIWGGDEACAHEWGETVIERATNQTDKRRWQHTRNGRGEEQPTEKRVGWLRSDIPQGQFCQKCGAWAGAHGLEPLFDLYVANEVAIFREVRRVLRSDGTLWLNLGDSYATGTGKVGDCPGGGKKGERWRGGHEGKHGYAAAVGPDTQPNRMPQPGLKAKDLCGIPWRVAFALQADGWWLRQDIIWSKPNPMPESIADRCTKAHEYLFLLSKSERYYFDHDAIREEFVGERLTDLDGGPQRNRDGSNANGGRNYNANRSSYKPGSASNMNGGTHVKKSDAGLPINPVGRNKRSVWTVATEPFPEAHFATFPPALIVPCIDAGTSARGCCVVCNRGWQRITRKVDTGKKQKMPDGMATYAGTHSAIHKDGREKGVTGNPVLAKETIGFYPACNCEGLPALPPYPPKPSRAALGDEAAYKRALSEHLAACGAIDDERAQLCAGAADRPTAKAVVLDPFGGAGTTGLVADRRGRNAILIERNPQYAAMAARRIEQDAGLMASVDLAEEKATAPTLFDLAQFDAANTLPRDVSRGR